MISEKHLAQYENKIKTFSDKTKAVHFQLRGVLDEGKCLHIETGMYEEKMTTISKLALVEI